jgi:hypothetical protein
MEKCVVHRQDTLQFGRIHTTELLFLQNFFVAISVKKNFVVAKRYESKCGRIH